MPIQNIITNGASDVECAALSKLMFSLPSDFNMAILIANVASKAMIDVSFNHLYLEASMMCKFPLDDALLKIERFILPTNQQ